VMSVKSPRKVRESPRAVLCVRGLYERRVDRCHSVTAKGGFTVAFRSVIGL
jgi:hypothetical protein